jgi:DNA-binding CsgD family transcriptional regulator/DNA-binding XRE family transcriptional regulator
MPTEEITPNELFARRLREAREQQGLSQQALAELMEQLGWEGDRLTILKIERAGREGAANPRGVSVGEAFWFAQALDVSPTQLFTPAPDEIVGIGVPPGTFEGDPFDYVTRDRDTFVRWLSVASDLESEIVSMEERLDALQQQLEQTRGKLRAMNQEPPELTARERDILQLMAAGVSTQDIAKRLHISQETAKSHVRRINAKLSLERAEQLRA